MSVESRPRLLLADDNLRAVGGHFFELASLWADAGRQAGREVTVATHQSFRPPESSAAGSDASRHILPPVRWLPTFATHRLVRWSLGVDGRSELPRDLAGNPMHRPVAAWWTDRMRRSLHPKSQQPTVMLDQWATDFHQCIKTFAPSVNDHVVVNTCDDFTALAVAAAIVRLPPQPRFPLHLVFHFAVDGDRQTQRRKDYLAQQIRPAINVLSRQRLRLHATTEALADQLNRVDLGAPVSEVPYPTRLAELRSGGSSVPKCPLRVALAGSPRAEKGRRAIGTLLTSIDQKLLQTGRLQLAIQLPSKQWRRTIPSSLREDVDQAIQHPSPRDRLQIQTSDLSTSDYHTWLDTADVGLFLYDPNRYGVRCSGVLLEMLARGVPVIVPDHCWLADQVRLGTRWAKSPVGVIYSDRNDIPGILSRLDQEFLALRRSCLTYAANIRRRHHPRHSLATLGVTDKYHRKVA
ncbi:MAG: hypothetical protein AAGA03_04750 [Planctomycetota bacterium]